MKTELKRIVTSGTGEREVHGFLKKFPALVRVALGKQDTGGYVLSEFTIGGDHRADLVSIWPTSAWFHISFIELEPVDAPLFKKNGEPRKELNHAFHQIDAWRVLIERDRLHVIRKLASAAATKDLLYRRVREPEEVTCTAGLKFDDPRMAFSFDYFIFMGRRLGLSETELNFKNQFQANRGVHVATYDRLLDAVENLDILGWQYDQDG